MNDDDIVVAEDGTALPAVDVLTGRGFITGKSGSGKSNTANVVVEGLLEADHSLLIVDIDGEYWGLKERYSILHAGGGGRCDVTVDERDAETLVDIALDGQPVILDLSGYLRAEESAAVLEAVLERLFRRETEVRKPFLLVVEEIHEFVPQKGSRDDVGDVLLQIAKRGRKHGLGLLGLSQRPAAVDKDFVTQCDWMVWHKLTWDNDTDVVRRLLGTDAAEKITDFEPGEAFLRTDWTDETRRIHFCEKRTYDAGTTPGMSDSDPPSLVDVDKAILKRFDREDPKPANESGDDSAEPTAPGATATQPTASTSTTSDGGTASATPRSRTSAEETAVDMLVEFAFMLAHLAVRAVQASVRGLRRAEDRAVDAVTQRLDDRGWSSLPVRLVLRVVLVLAVIVAIVFTTA